MAISNQTRAVTLTTSNYLTLPINNGISRNGYWYFYTPVNASNNTTGAEIRPYNFGSALSLVNSQTDITIDGTLPLLEETWEGSTQKYHGGVIEHIGAGTNDITNATEDDAFMFGHMGAYAASDDAFYWDRLFLAEGASEWDYYQYHKHLPSFYAQYEQGRQTTSGGGFIDEDDKSFGYMITNRVTSGGTPYSNVLARIHTPSIGGAHNSHNDVTLPSTGADHYMNSGILRGVGDRYHAFYIADDGSDWKIYSRTYTDAALSFTVEEDLGTYDLADPTFAPADTTGTSSQYPLRASCGDVLSSKIYFPVILNNQTSGFDLEIWSYDSTTGLTSGTLTRHSIETGVSVRPDCQCLTVGSRLYILYTNVASGGIDLQYYDGSSWTDEGQVLTNSSSNYVRVHGFRYNSADTKFYCLLSGTSGGGSPTYLGPGAYSFSVSGTFSGYPHLDYNATNNEYLTKAANTAGYLEYDNSSGGLTKYTTTEPQAISTEKRILEYAAGSDEFKNRYEINLGGEEYFFDGIQLQDGRKCLVGRVEDLSGSLGHGDLLFTVKRTDRDETDLDINIVHGGAGDDYFTGVQQNAAGDKIWFSGYTKSELVDKKDIKIHGYTRVARDGTNQITWTDIAKDSVGDIYTVGTHSANYIMVAKYNYNYELQWQKKYSGSLTYSGDSYITIDSNDNIYVSTTESDTDNKAVLLKLTSAGALTFAKQIAMSGQDLAGAGIATISDSGTEYIVQAVNYSTNAFFFIYDTDGVVDEYSQFSNLNIKRVRDNPHNNDVGRFLFAGTNGAGESRFGMGERDNTTRMIQWFYAFDTAATASVAYDIRNIDEDDTSGNDSGYIIVGDSDGDGFVLKVQLDQTGFNVTKTWAQTVTSTNFTSVQVDDPSDSTRNIYVCGYTSADGRGAEDGVVIKYNNSGTIQWQNTFGFGDNERFTGIEFDVTDDNLILSGYTESHTNGRNGVTFRCWKEGFGTGNYHIEGNSGTALWYEASALTDSTEAASITLVTNPNDNQLSYTQSTEGDGSLSNSAFTVDIYDGSYGTDGVFMGFFGYADLNKVQDCFNTDNYINNKKLGLNYVYDSTPFTFYQFATVGDGSADDGNIFFYDILEHSGGSINAVGSVSGNVAKTNTGTSGVYDYILVHLMPDGSFMYFQNGDANDEEVYALTELNDGKIAFVGRSTGGLGSHTNQGGYDIFLGVHEMSGHTTDYYQIGSGFDDRGLNVHDYHDQEANTLLVMYGSYGALPGNTNSGGEDMGIVKFNYVTDTWGTAYQTGSTATNVSFTQNGSHSTLLADGRVAITGHSSGFFADDNVTSGLLDILLGILDLSDGTWSRYQVGTGANDFGAAIFSVGSRLSIIGHTEAAFADDLHGLYVQFDALNGFAGKSSA